MPGLTKREGLLLDVHWLRNHAGDPGLRIVDSRSRDDFEKGHIPGAVNLDLYALHWADTTPEGLQRFRSLLEGALSAAGVGNEHCVVFYEDFSGMRAARGFWILEYFGHDDVYLLDGGLRVWTAAGLPVESGPRELPPAHFVAKVNPDLVAGFRDVLDRLRSPDVKIVDTRSIEEYTGEKIQAARAGAIPGAVHLEWLQNLRPDGTFKSPEEINAMYESRGVRPAQEVITYCQGGYRAAHTYLALRIANYPKVRNYIGSWQEWGDRTELPIETPVR